MAWIREREGGFLVAWREGGRERSRFVRGSRADAEAVRAEVEREQDAARILATVPGIPGWDGRALVDSLEPEFAFQAYLRRLVEQDTELRESVRVVYLTGLRNHIDDTPLGRSDIRSIGPDAVEEFWAGVETARRSVYQLLAKGFNAAVRQGIIPASPLVRSNVKRPSTRIRPEDRPLTSDELERLADGAASPRARMAILLMGYCGLRAGEVGGIRVQDVTFGPRPRLTIRQAVVQTRGMKYLSLPKTKASRRTVALPRSVADELEAFAASNPPAADGRLFHRGNGELWAHQSINAAVQGASRRAGLPPVHAHQLRHSAVSLLIDDGANPKAIQAFVGHSDIRMTLGVYGHLFDQGGEALAASMDRRRASRT